MSEDGKRVAIGANGSGRGYVGIYDLIDSTWIPVGENIDGEGDDDESGNLVAMLLDGKRIAIGASKNKGNGRNNSGHVRIWIDTMTSQSPTMTPF